ncbi:N-acetyltransferase [Clostridioides sp. ZZV14-6104]|nr:N-acetyltransferase [Clostridioides sp. ZZV14-6104]
MKMIIRQEKASDKNKVYEVVKSAFANEDSSDHDEQNLVNRLRNSTSFVPELSLVAEDDGNIVGHILFTEIKVKNNVLLALAPVSVSPNVQGKKIGSKLIEEGHKIAKSKGYKGCVVLGHDKYYPKFGYQVASKFNIKAPFEVPDENFMAIELLDNGLKEVSGVVEYAKEFFEQ